MKRLLLPILSALACAVWLLPRTLAQPLSGQIVIDPEHPSWLKRHGGAHVFICGPGDPEGFLYRGTRRPDGTRDGDQEALIEKLIRHGGNCIYMQIVRTHGGDAKPDTTHNPFNDSDPGKGIDHRILDQWERWFTRMDENGILIYLFFYDDSARIWNTGDAVGPQEQMFLETIVRKFQHHRNLIWVFGEESEERYTKARVNASAAIIRAADRHGHLIGDHHHSGTNFKSFDPAGVLNHYSMQLNVAVEPAHAGAIAARRLAAERYQVIYSEDTAMLTDVDGMRRHAWAVAMGGVMPMLLRMEIADTPVESLQQCRHLQRFFEQTDFFTMESRDELKAAGTKYVLADAGRSYIAYADTAGAALGLKDLPAGECEITWVDCVTGQTVAQQQTLSARGTGPFQRPANFGAECAAWIRFPQIAPLRRAPVAAATPAPAPPRANRPPVVSDHTFTAQAGSPTYVQLRFTDDDGPGPYTYTIVERPRHGTLAGDDNDRTYTPEKGFIGRDRFTWRVHDGVAESAVATVTIEVGGAVSSHGTSWNALGEVHELGAGITPGVAIDPAGTIHVVFMHGGAIVHRQAAHDESFSAPESVPLPEGPADYNSPHLVCDARGTLHMVFTRGTTGRATKAWYAARRGGRWSAPLLVLDHSTTGRRVNYPRIAVATDGATAFVGGFAGGGSTIVRIDKLDTSPQIAARADTPLWVAHPLIAAGGEVLVVGRAGASGHKLESYTHALERRGEPVLLSRGTPTKTYEATAALLDERGIVHAVGAAGSPEQVMWYNSSERAMVGKPVVLGPALGHDIREYSYPVMLRDARGRLYVSYRDQATGESKLTILEPGGERFADPVVVAPAITQRLRWNAHLAAAPGGGVYAAWDVEGRIYVRAVGEAAQKTLGLR